MMRVVVSVIELQKWYCMCFGSVGLRRMYGLVVLSDFKNSRLSKWILDSW